MAKKKTKAEIGDELSTVIDDCLTKKFKDMEKVVYNLGEPELTPADITGWVSTGNDILDLYIANSPHKGLPVGRIIEVAGLEASAKSLLCAHILAETQKQNGIAYLIDTESAMFREFFQAVGVDLSKLKYSIFDTIEDIFEAITNVVEVVRKSDSDKLVTIVVDSVAGASTKLEMEDDFDKDGYATGKAIILSKAMRKITNMISKEKILLVFTNQYRINMNSAAFGEKYGTSGGKAIGFHSSVRLKMVNIGNIKKSGDNKDVIGSKIEVTVKKNRVGPPLRKMQFEVYFASGIDNYKSWLTVLKDRNLIKLSGSTYTVTMPDETEYKFMSKDFANLMQSNPDLKEYLYNKICDAVILKYDDKKNTNSNTNVVKDDIDVETETDEISDITDDDE